MISTVDSEEVEGAGLAGGKAGLGGAETGLAEIGAGLARGEAGCFGSVKSSELGKCMRQRKRARKGNSR